MKFSKDNQPQNRGRKPNERKKVVLHVSVLPETKEYYSKRGLAERVLEEYKQLNEK